MLGARCTRSLVCSVLVAHEGSHHGRTGITRHSRTRVVLTVSFVIFPAIGLSCHRRPADMVMSAPGRADLTSKGLDAGVEASGPHDFAVRQRLRSSARFLRSLTGNPSRDHLAPDAARVHRIPSRVRDDRDTPLMWDETASDIDLIWVDREAEFFCKGDRTAELQGSPTGKLADLPAAARTAKTVGVTRLFIVGDRRIAIG